MNRHLLGLLVGAGVFTAGTAAHAQEAGVVEGPGVSIGEATVVHPTVGADLGFTNNVYYTDSDNTASGLFRLVASFAIASKDAEQAPVDPLLIEGEDDVPAEPAHQRIAFRAGGMIRYQEYLSTSEAVRSQRDLGFNLNAHLEVEPQGKVSFIGDEELIRDTRPTNFESFGDNNRIANSLDLGIRFQPGGGTMNGQLRWQNYIDYFESGVDRFANRMINAIRARYEWRLFPYTQLYADASYGFVSGFASSDLGGMPYKRSANPIWGGIGINTVITELITVKAHVGWNYAAYDGGASYNLPKGGVELGYRYSPTGRFVLAYDFVHRDSINSDFYRDHQFEAHVDQQIRQFVLTARADMRLRHYEGISPAIGAPTRDDFLVGIGARGQYVLKDTFAIVAEWLTGIDQTDYMYDTGNGFDDPSYVRTEITAGVRAAF